MANVQTLFERAIAEYEEELSRSMEKERQRRLPEVWRQRADIHQLLLVKEEVPSEQQDWSSSLDQDDPEPPHIKEDPEPPQIEDPVPPHIKEELEELWISQVGAQLQGLEEADQMETENDGTDCGGPEPDKKSDSERHPGPETLDSSEPETDDSTDWKDTQEPHSDLNSVQNNEVPVSDVNCSTGNTLVRLPECAESFDHTRHLKRHAKSKRRVIPYECSVCHKTFRFHMIGHTGENVFSCCVCRKIFRRIGYIKTHMMNHTGEKPFSCSVCGSSFTRNQSLKSHMICHSGEKPFSCSVCRKAFAHKQTLKRHLTCHTGEKPFSCSFCGKTFSLKGNLKVHMTMHTGEK